MVSVFEDVYMLWSSHWQQHDSFCMLSPLTLDVMITSLIYVEACKQKTSLFVLVYELITA